MKVHENDWCMAHKCENPNSNVIGEHRYTTDCGHCYSRNDKEKPYEYCPFCKKPSVVD